MYPVLALLFAALLSATQREGSCGSEPLYAMHPEYNAIIVCDDPVIDIGTIWAGPDIQARFPIRNEGTETAWIQVTFSGVTSITPCVTMIEPGDTVYVSVNVRSTHLRGSFAKNLFVRLIDEPVIAVPACFGAPGYSDWCIRHSETD